VVYVVLWLPLGIVWTLLNAFGLYRICSSVDVE
jgi:hypothetical protein